MTSPAARFVTPPPDAGLLPGGRDNAAIRVGRDLVARLPLHSNAAPLMEHEQRWLPGIASQLPVRTSAPVVAGRPGSGYPHPWSVADWIEGGTADRTPYDPALAAPVLVSLFHSLHQPAPPDAPRNPLRSVPLSQRLPRFREHLADLRHPEPDSARRRAGRDRCAPRAVRSADLDARRPAPPQRDRRRRCGCCFRRRSTEEYGRRSAPTTSRGSGRGAGPWSSGCCSW